MKDDTGKLDEDQLGRGIGQTIYISEDYQTSGN